MVRACDGADANGPSLLFEPFLPRRRARTLLANRHACRSLRGRSARKDQPQRLRERRRDVHSVRARHEEVLERLLGEETSLRERLHEDEGVGCAEELDVTGTFEHEGAEVRFAFTRDGERRSVALKTKDGAPLLDSLFENGIDTSTYFGGAAHVRGAVDVEPMLRDGDDAAFERVRRVGKSNGIAGGGRRRLAGCAP